jgi:hypothetical protein
MYKIKCALMAVALAVIGIGACLLPAGSAYAVNGGAWSDGMNVSKGNGVPDNLMGSGGAVTNIINGVLYVVGILAVVMVIIGGVKYTTSGGDQQAVTSTKNTILYGIVGLVIAILAYAIVNFVIEKI